MDADTDKRITALSKRVSTLETENEMILDRIEGLTKAALILSKLSDRATDAADAVYRDRGNRVRPLLVGETEEELPQTAKMALKLETEEAKALRLLRQNATLERRKAIADRAKKRAEKEARAASLRAKVGGLSL